MRLLETLYKANKNASAFYRFITVFLMCLNKLLFCKSLAFLKGQLFCKAHNYSQRRSFEIFSFSEHFSHSDTHSQALSTTKSGLDYNSNQSPKALLKNGKPLAFRRKDSLVLKIVFCYKTLSAVLGLR